MWQAYYFNGLSAARIAVTVKLAPDSIQILTDDRKVVVWPYAEITVQCAYHAGTAMRLERGMERLNVNSPDFPSAFKTASPMHSSFLGTPKKRRDTRRSVGIIAALATILFSLYFWIIPFSADYAAATIPPAWEAKLGASIAGNFKEQLQVCDNPLAKRSLESIVSILDATAQPHPYTFSVHIVKFPMVNALAAPGGHIIVFSGLLEKTNRPEELAGVLAHEMQHVLKRHATKSIFHNMGAYLLTTLLTGGSSNAGIINTFAAMRYSQANESEADMAGLRLLQKTGVDPSGMVDFFKTMENAEEEKLKHVPSVFSYISSHPQTAERVKRLNSEIAAHPSEITTSLAIPDMEWKDVASACSEPTVNRTVEDEAQGPASRTEAQ